MKSACLPVCLSACLSVCLTAEAAPLMYMGTHAQHIAKNDHNDLAAILLFDVVAENGHNYLTIQLINASAVPCGSDMDILTSVFFGLKSYQEKGVVGPMGQMGYPELIPVSAKLASANPDLADDVYAMWIGTEFEAQAAAASALLRENSVLKMYDKGTETVIASAPASLNDKWGFANGLTDENALSYFPTTPTPYYGISSSSLEGAFKDLGQRFDGDSFGTLTGDAGHGLLSKDTIIGKEFDAPKDWFVVGSMIFTFLLPDEYILDLEHDIILENEEDEYGNATRSSVWFAYRKTLNGDSKDPIIRGQDMGYVPDSRIPEPVSMSLLALGGLALIRRRSR